MQDAHTIYPIAHIKSEFSEKFGIPRQSGLAQTTAEIHFAPPYRNADAVRELSGCSHIWLIWQFSKAKDAPFSPTVRPPKLGGNRRVGVFATRSPFRPNALGLSLVRLVSVDLTCENAPILTVSGADLLSGTPIYDIKPYLPYADCRPEAVCTVANPPEYLLAVDFPEALLEKIPQKHRQALLEVLACDPRPGYQDDPARLYGLCFAGFDIGFRVESGRLAVCRVSEDEKLK